MASSEPPVRGAAFAFEISLFLDNPTLAAGDVKVIKDGVLDGNIDTLPTVVAGLTRVLTVALSAAEMTADRVTVLFHDAAGSEWQDAVVTIYTAAQTQDAMAAEIAKVPKSDSNVTWNSTALASINTEVDTALNTVIPGSPTANSVNALVVAIAETSGAGDVSAISHTITVQDGGGALSGVLVQISTDSGKVNVIRSGSTNDLGQVTFYLDAGTYYAWSSRAETDFTNPATVTVA